jgi:hypothetical protein
VTRIVVIEFLQKAKRAYAKNPESLVWVRELIEDACTGEGDEGDIPEIAKTMLEILEPERIGGIEWMTGE